MPFFLLKGLSFLPFGGFLKNPKLLIGIILIAIIGFAIWKWKQSIEEAAYNAIFTEQAEQHLQNQRREQERVQKLIEQGNKAVAEAQKRREDLIQEVERARARTRNVDPEQNGPVAPVLKEALEWIRLQEGVGAPESPPEKTLGERAGELWNRSTEAAGSAVESTGNAAIDAWKKIRSNP